MIYADALLGLGSPWGRHLGPTPSLSPPPQPETRSSAQVMRRRLAPGIRRRPRRTSPIHGQYTLSSLVLQETRDNDRLLRTKGLREQCGTI
jgi:hypothetical protein